LTGKGPLTERVVATTLPAIHLYQLSNSMLLLYGANGRS